MKPPSRKHYEKSEVERLKEQVRKLESKPPEFELLKRMLESEKDEVRTWKAGYTNLRKHSEDLEKYKQYLAFLATQEVFIADDEGMKVLKGEDLFAYCHKRVEQAVEEDRKRHAGYETISLGGFAGFASQAITEIIRDEVDKCATLDTYKYTTKGRYDTRGKSKKESR